MNDILNYSQFIEGKLSGHLQYKIVAHTADLKNSEKLNYLVQNYRFWGTHPPNSEKFQDSRNILSR